MIYAIKIILIHFNLMIYPFNGNFAPHSRLLRREIKRQLPTGSRTKYLFGSFGCFLSMWIRYVPRRANLNLHPFTEHCILQFLSTSGVNICNILLLIILLWICVWWTFLDLFFFSNTFNNSWNCNLNRLDQYFNSSNFSKFCEKASVAERSHRPLECWCLF